MDNLKELGLDENDDKGKGNGDGDKKEGGGVKERKGNLKKGKKGKGKKKKVSDEKEIIDKGKGKENAIDDIAKRKVKKKKGLKKKTKNNDDNNNNNIKQKTVMFADSVIQSNREKKPLPKRLNPPQSLKKSEIGYFSKFKSFLPKFLSNIINSTEPNLKDLNNNDLDDNNNNNTNTDTNTNNKIELPSLNLPKNERQIFHAQSTPFPYNNLSTNNNPSSVNLSKTNANDNTFRSDNSMSPIPILKTLSPTINSKEKDKDQKPLSSRLITSFGKLYNHDNPITSRSIFQSENIISLLQFPSFPCPLNQYNTTSSDININEQSKWIHIFNHKDYDDPKHVNQTNKFSFLPNEKFDSIFSCYFLINKFSRAVLTVITNQRLLFLDMQQMCLILFKSCKINDLTAIYYYEEEILFYPKTEGVIHLKMTKTKRTHMTPEEVFISSKDKAKKDAEVKQGDKGDMKQYKSNSEANNKAIKQIAIKIWRIYLSITLSPLFIMEIFTDGLFRELDEKKSIMEVSLLIMMQQKTRIFKSIKHKKDVKRTRKDNRFEQQTLKSKGHLSVYKNFEQEFNAKPFNGIGYILNPDDEHELSYSLCYFLNTSEYIILYLYQKSDMLLLIEFERILSVKINKDRYVMVLDLVNGGKKKESMVTDLYLKISRGVAIDNSVFSLERIVLFTCGNDDPLSPFFKSFAYQFIEKNLQSPELFILTECYTKDLVNLTLPEMQEFLNLAKNNRENSVIDKDNQDNDLNKWEKVPVAKSNHSCCCCKKDPNANTSKLQSTSNNKALFLSNLHPEERNDKCLIY